MKIPCTKHRLTMMSKKGDAPVAEWDTATATDARIAEIETEFNDFMKKGYVAANLETNELIKNFDPNADAILIPRMMGGSY